MDNVLAWLYTMLEQCCHFRQITEKSSLPQQDQMKILKMLEVCNTIR